MLQAEKLEIGYQNTLATAELLQLSQGQMHALVGRNGTGKSTLLQSLQGLLPLLKGTISINDKAISKWSSIDLAQNFAWVNTRFQGIQHLNVVEYVLLGRTPYFNRFGSQHENDLKVALMALDRVGGMDLKNKDTLYISDGERQLISIARALAQDTPFIFLDEPTAFLDFYHRKAIFSLLQKIAKEENKGILVSTHDLDLVIQFKLPLILVSQLGNITQEKPYETVASLEKILSQ